MKDRIYRKVFSKIQPFQFDKKVAHSFDDMLFRSIPYYKTILDYSVNITYKIYYQKPFSIMDIGCSTGNILNFLIDKFNKDSHSYFSYTGIDKSINMIDICKKKFSTKKYKNKISFLQEDALNFIYSSYDVFFAHFILQFIPIERRAFLLEKIYDSLPQDGICFISEKVLDNNSIVNSFLNNQYYDFKKKNRYSFLEIQNKQKSLENVLIPIPIEKYINLFREVGFHKISILLKHFNFITFFLQK